MSSAEEGLKIGADLSMWVFIASLVFFAVSVLTSLYNRLDYKNLKSVYTYVNEYADFNNKVVAGDSVQQCIEKYKDTIFIRVATDKCPTGITEKDLNNVKNLDSKSYVNPVCNYYGTLLKDKNGDAVGINFEQNGLNLSEEQITTAIQDCKQKLEE